MAVTEEEGRRRKCQARCKETEILKNESPTASEGFYA